MALSSIMIAKLKLSVEINGVFVPFNRVIESIRRHSSPLLHYIDNGDGLDLGYAGSSLLVMQGDQLIQIFSNHQLVNLGIDPSDVLIYRDELSEKKALGPCEVISTSISQQQIAGLDDIKIVRYESTTKPDELRNRFLSNQLTEMQTLDEVPPQAVQIIFTVGFPFESSQTDLQFDEEACQFCDVHVHSRSTKLYLKLTPRKRIDPPKRLPLEILDGFELPPGYDFNGFSGSHVFFIWQDEDSVAQLGFAGMITEVLMGTRLELYPGSTIRQILTQL